MINAKRISTVPQIENGVKLSCRIIVPSIPAIKGLIAQNKAAFSEGTLLCATGCSVKPKQVHTAASMSTIRYCSVEVGSV